MYRNARDTVQWCEECDLVAQNAKNSLIWLVHKASPLKSHWFKEPRSLAKFSFFNISPSFGDDIYLKTIPKISLIFFNPMIIFYCEITKKTKMGALFRSVKLEMHVLRYEFQTYTWHQNSHQYTFSKYIQNQISSSFSRDLSVSARQNLSKIFIGSLIFSRKLAILIIFLPKSHVSIFGNNDGWNFKQKPLYS